MQPSVSALGCPRADRPRELDPVAAGTGDLERVQQQVVAGDGAARRELELRRRRARRARRAPCPSSCGRSRGGEDLLGLGHQLGLGVPTSYAASTAQKPASLIRMLSRTSSSSSSLLTARARSNLVEGDELEALGQRAVVAHSHHVVEPVDADPPHALRAPGRGSTRPGARRRPALDPASAWSPTQRASRGKTSAARRRPAAHVGVAVDDAEAGEVADGALEARVLGAGDEERVDAGSAAAPRGRSRSGARSRPAWLRRSRSLSTPLISAVIARFSGARRRGARRSRRWRRSGSRPRSRRPASTSWSMVGLWS